jgi:hypothetical protein
VKNIASAPKADRFLTKRKQEWRGGEIWGQIWPVTDELTSYESTTHKKSIDFFHSSFFWLHGRGKNSALDWHSIDHLAAIISLILCETTMCGKVSPAMSESDAAKS